MENNTKRTLCRTSQGNKLNSIQKELGSIQDTVSCHVLDAPNAIWHHQTGRVAIRRRLANSRLERNRLNFDFCREMQEIAIAGRHVVSDLAKRKGKRMCGLRKMRRES